MAALYGRFSMHGDRALDTGARSADAHAVFS
jgi:hypothetical protein